MPADGRLLFIDGQIAVASSMPQVKEKRTVVDYLFALSLEDKRKLLGALRGLDDEEQDELLSIIIRSKNLVNEGC